MITPDFCSYAASIEVRIDEGVSPSLLQERTVSLLVNIARECMKAGATLIGHIKCLVETEGHGYLAVSVVDGNGTPRSRGQLHEGLNHADIALNVLLYGLPLDQVRSIVGRQVDKLLILPGWRIELRVWGGNDVEGSTEHHIHSSQGHHHGDGPHGR